MMDEVFPVLSEIPVQLRTHFQQMISWLDQADDVLPRYEIFEHIYQVLDEEGTLRCLFKEPQDGSEVSAKKEACVYLLDHPYNNQRSRSENIYGYAGVLPTVFVRFTKGNRNMMGVLIDYVETVGNVAEYSTRYPHAPISAAQMEKVAMLDLRLGNMDRNPDNMLVRLDDGGSPHVIPIDHEMIFANEVQNYNIVSPPPHWLQLHERSVVDVNKEFSAESVSYLERLQPEEDIEFLTRCGWEPGMVFGERFKIFTAFLKTGVSLGITVYHLGLIAAYKCDDMTFNLQDIVEHVERDEAFVANVNIAIWDRLTDYNEE
ncbi:unnamed protein product [Microthlaspi erraticum]|uniref:1-phosphatidylinositol 4-kinase n=1 Tax=Microthlaspi erraticum TaxID=1685480 RepID=A0A6D2I8X4_9BRAS|nr:unnamed protein product [Microthlaspi erraticum]